MGGEGSTTCTGATAGLLPLQHTSHSGHRTLRHTLQHPPLCAAACSPL
jgi:hypothetical protein